MSKAHTQNIATLSRLFLSARGVASMGNLVKGLFTENEITELVRRVEIVKMLKRGMPHHKIALTLGVGVATVTRGAREIKMGRFKNV
ncbi:MAG TPA: Trp family transcriptional regulator [Candidatus Woesebacteria bacterium]|nr:Trp family transcriptional regulator [Candidatus Woesebacteria bacterium]HNS95071.1 Trp family transcriptional regulator [Candidatus Woesebacteria bacterium]